MRDLIHKAVLDTLKTMQEDVKQRPLTLEERKLADLDAISIEKIINKIVGK